MRTAGERRHLGGVYDVERTVRALAAGLETLESLATLPNDDENEP